MILAKILVNAGTEVKVGEVICVSVDDVKDVKAFENYKNDGSE